jgi:hypothetical protein
MREPERTIELPYYNNTMALLDKILGRPLASWEHKEQKIGPVTGIPLLGLDSLASTGYGPEAALMILASLGVQGLSYFPIIIVLIVINLTTLCLSYRQTIAAFPQGGRARGYASGFLRNS